MINGQDFTRKRFRNRTLLLDTKTKVADDLLVVILKAAILGHWDRGSIRLETGDWQDQHGKTRNCLLAIPTGKLVAWPEDTVESRLVLDRTRPIVEIMMEWLTHQASEPTSRGIEKVKILMTLRGLASVTFIPRDGRAYCYSLEPDGIDLKAASKTIQAMIERAEQAMPEIAPKLHQAIEKAIKQNEYRGEYSREVDPWLDEAAIRVEPYREYFGNHLTSQFSPLLKTLGIAALWLALIELIFSGFAYLIPGLTTLLIVSVYVRFIYDPKLESSPEPNKLRAFITQRAVYVVPALFCALTVFHAFFENYPIPAAIAGLIALFLVSRRALRAKMKARISALVMQQAETAMGYKHDESGSEPAKLQSTVEPTTVRSARESEPPDLREVMQTIENSNDVLRIELVEPEALPAGSEESNRRLEHIVKRGNALHQTYAYFLLALATAVTGMAYFAWVFGLGELGGSQSGYSLSAGVLTTYGTPQYPTGIIIFYGITVLFILLARILISGVPARMRKLYNFAEVKSDARAYKQFTEAEVIPIKPYFTTLLILVWSILSINAISDYAKAPAPWHLVLTLAALLLPLLLLVIFRSVRKHLENKYPVFPPLNLLALRVFDSTDLNDYLLQMHRWHWLGIMQMMEGPDNSGEDLADFFLYISGSIEDAVVKDETGLLAALKKLNTQRDSQLRFSTNSLQCNDATWKLGLDYMLEKSHVVVMDLSGFSRDNSGSSYEISLLLNRLPLSRFFFLVNNSTDLSYLNSLLQNAWNNLLPDSPNLNYTEPTLRLFNNGGGIEREEDETKTEWEYRLRSRLDRQKLVAMLCDAALSVEQHNIENTLLTPVDTAWTISWIPGGIRKLITAGAFILVLYTLASSWMFLSAERAPLSLIDSGVVQ
ncbi:MAG: hypothetical protein WDZ52_01315 [Pseudohongiellaceae bacterium]